MRQKICLILLFLTILCLLCSCREENASDFSLWQAFAEDGRETAQLVLTNEQAKIYYYTFFQPDKGANFLKNAYLAEFSLQKENNLLLGKSNYAYFADCSFAINEDVLTITWLGSDEKYIIPPVSNNFYRVEEKSVEKVLASRPFFAEDLVFPFDTHISVEKFINLYGEPLDIIYNPPADELYSEENPDGELIQHITLYYDGATVRFVYFPQWNSYLIYNLEASSEEFFPTVRGMSVLGMHYTDILQSFRLEHDLTCYELDYAKDVDENNLPPAYSLYYYDNKPVFYLTMYGRETYLRSYGMIIDGAVIYNNENINFQLYFTDEKVSGFSYYESEFY